MEALIQQVAAGLASGCVYAALALALVMIHQATHHINFAQGEMATFSTYVAWALMQQGLPWLAALAAAAALSFAGGAALQRVVLRPLESAPVTSQVIAFVGLLAIFNALSGWLFGHTIKAVASPFAADGPLASRWFSAHQAGSMLVTALVLAALWAFLRLTSLGLALRAAALNPASARLVGIRVARMRMLGWGLAAAVGAVAGTLVAPVVFLEPNMMSGTLLYAFAAALLGGLSHPAGAVAGGLLVGVLENLLGAYVIGTELKMSVALALIVGVLMLRPQGLFGRAVIERV